MTLNSVIDDVVTFKSGQDCLKFQDNNGWSHQTEFWNMKKKPRICEPSSSGLPSPQSMLGLLPSTDLSRKPMKTQNKPNNTIMKC